MTDNQHKTIQFLKSFHVKHGFYPTLREIGDHFKITIGSVQDRIGGLKKQGYLTWLPGKPRTFKILGEA